MKLIPKYLPRSFFLLLCTTFLLGLMLAGTAIWFGYFWLAMIGVVLMLYIKSIWDGIWDEAFTPC